MSINPNLSLMDNYEGVLTEIRNELLFAITQETHRFPPALEPTTIISLRRDLNVPVTKYWVDDAGVVQNLDGSSYNLVMGKFLHDLVTKIDNSLTELRGQYEKYHNLSRELVQAITNAKRVLGQTDARDEQNKITSESEE